MWADPKPSRSDRVRNTLLTNRELGKLQTSYAAYDP